MRRRSHKIALSFNLIQPPTTHEDDGCHCWNKRHHSAHKSTSKHAHKSFSRLRTTWTYFSRSSQPLVELEYDFQLELLYDYNTAGASYMTPWTLWLAKAKMFCVKLVYWALTWLQVGLRAEWCFLFQEWQEVLLWCYECCNSEGISVVRWSLGMSHNWGELNTGRTKEWKLKAELRDVSLDLVGGNGSNGE